MKKKEFVFTENKQNADLREFLTSDPSEYMLS